MYTATLHQQVNKILLQNNIDIAGIDNHFYTRFIANASAIHQLYNEVYSQHANKELLFNSLLQTIVDAYLQRPFAYKKQDLDKEIQGNWFLSNDITGMSLYVDRFCGNLQNLSTKLPYFKNLGVNFLHLMPIMQSPANESDGGYAVSDFRKVDERFGTLKDLKKVKENMSKEGMYLMLDIVLNHTSHHHEWAVNAKQGDKASQDFFYMYDDREMPDKMEAFMPEIFPESSPGNFTWSPECKKWVMTVFHQYQWDLNYANPAVFNAMLDTIFFYANIGVDILRIDAPAFIWKQLGTTCQNLPQAHTLLRLIKQCVQVATPGMALLGEAIVAPKEIMKYFGTNEYTARECDFAYNATQMALQWDALATGDIQVMMAAQHEILQKPFGTSWITYTRCHDDIGLGYDDYMIDQAGFNPYEHRKFLKEYYGGILHHSPAAGALFSVNPKTQDARISGTLASLCGLEKALAANDEHLIATAIKKIILMQAHSFFIGGVPMLFYGDEIGYTNDYTYQQDASKSYDNRWMHRPLIDWNKVAQKDIKGTAEHQIFEAIKQLINIRKQMAVVADNKNLLWMATYSKHLAAFLRFKATEKLYCIYNFSGYTTYLPWHSFKQHGPAPSNLLDHYTNTTIQVGYDHEHLVIQPYTFMILQSV